MIASARPVQGPERSELEKAVQEFLANGGQVTKLPPEYHPSGALFVELEDYERDDEIVALPQ